MQVLAHQLVTLLGLDFGSTTCSAMVAEAYVVSNSVTGRMEFGEPRIIFKSAPVFTPFIRQSIDDAAVAVLIHDWLEQSGLELDANSGLPTIFAGGCIITGLAAQRQNATAIAHQITQLVGDAVIATAQDPSLESWLAFMGSCSALSRHHHQTHILNLDIGGGTTNVAIGQDGDVLNTGCYFVGARHFQFVPGSYRLISMSQYGAAILAGFGINKTLGDELDSQEREQILAYYCQTLEAIVLGERHYFEAPLAQLHEQVTFVHVMDNIDASSRPKITFSGGVGELLYRYMSGQPLPGTTYYGDFGIDLAIAIAQSPLLSADLQQYVPENQGRATVYGLTLHSTDISGTTLFLPAINCLPLKNLPIVSKLPILATSLQWAAALAMAKTRKQGACIQLHMDHDAILGLETVRLVGQRIAQALQETSYPVQQPLVILVERNVGKALGNYATDWAQTGQNLIVIDEVPVRNAHFVNIGRMHQQIVPISFFGLH